MDAQFADSLADGLDVALQAVGKAVQPSCDHASSTFVFEPHPPSPKDFGLLECVHQEK